MDTNSPLTLRSQARHAAVQRSAAQSPTSSRWFCMGVPDSSTRRLHSRLPSAWQSHSTRHTAQHPSLSCMIQKVAGSQAVAGWAVHRNIADTGPMADCADSRAAAPLGCHRTVSKVIITPPIHGKAILLPVRPPVTSKHHPAVRPSQTQSDPGRRTLLVRVASFFSLWASSHMSRSHAVGPRNRSACSRNVS